MIINLPKDLEGHTTHRYGPNSFKLHRRAAGRGRGGAGAGAAAGGRRRQLRCGGGASGGAAGGAEAAEGGPGPAAAGAAWQPGGPALTPASQTAAACPGPDHALSRPATPAASHRLPMPRPGQVLGLVGTNGIGKSTALKVRAEHEQAAPPRAPRAAPGSLLEEIAFAAPPSNPPPASPLTHPRASDPVGQAEAQPGALREPPRLGGDPGLLPRQRAAELLHQGAGGRPQGGWELHAWAAGGGRGNYFTTKVLEDDLKVGGNFTPGWGGRGKHSTKVLEDDLKVGGNFAGGVRELHIRGGRGDGSGGAFVLARPARGIGRASDLPPPRRPVPGC
jgi:hypothetical protein